jgi:CheY-like chemotaxis protein
MILVVDDSAVDRRLVGGILEKKFQWAIQYAANGVEALARMKGTKPDLVVTDLTMPMMDGLELVRYLRARHPEIPVILMTAYGSEALAIEALEQGASSYVPKSELAKRLPQTVEDVLKLARAGQSHEHLLQCLVKTGFSFCLENDPALVDPLVELVQQMVAGMRLTDFAGKLQIGVALREALLNALFHGNLEITAEEVKAVEDRLLGQDEVSLVEKRCAEEPYKSRKIFVEVRISQDEARFTIRDQGPGFDVSALRDMCECGALEGERGRGLWLMRTFMDEVICEPPGNQVVMVKRRDKAASAPAPPAASDAAPEAAPAPAPPDPGAGSSEARPGGESQAP